MGSRYNDLNTYLKNKYGAKVYKVCIDGSFTCPNRDGTKGYGGCSFCSGQGAGENIESQLTIEEQVRYSCLHSIKKHKAQKFIAYFQNFTGTYDSEEHLRQKYTSAIKNRDVVALSIATRPDCINENITALLNDIRTEYNVDIWVELGLQTTNDSIADAFNRCYKTEVFYKSVSLLREHSIDVIVHLLFGLPGETRESMLKTVRDVSVLDIQGIKFHCLYIVKGSMMEEDYNKQSYTPLTEDNYIELLVNSIKILPGHVVIHRLVSDCRRDMLVAPLWLGDKNEVLNRIQDSLEKNNIIQGSGI